MEPGSPETKRFRDLPYPSLNEALKAETRLAVKLSEVGKLGREKKPYYIIYEQTINLVAV